MPLLESLLALRRDSRMLKVPPYVSALLIIVGVAWLLVLPLNEYSRNTYISENALLPGQVHTYFGGSEHNLFRAYRQEVAALTSASEGDRIGKLVELLQGAGLKTATQKYKYEAAGVSTAGENVYAILKSPRADATEAVVLIAAWTSVNDVLNQSGVALLLTLARYFNKWSLWSKDIIFLISGDSMNGPKAWVDAYHDQHATEHIEPLTLRSGALQGAVAVEYTAGTWGHRFEQLHVLYDGINGQLPNLDLFNTAVSIAKGQMGIGCTLQRMWKHSDSYQERLQTMLRGMISQGLGHVSGPHSSFMPYHVDAITLQTVGDGWHDEMGLGRTLESIFRSLNNLLEHLHQSFFFYLLMQGNRFVSIGTYLPSAMLVAGNFTVMAIALWVQSGRPSKSSKNESLPDPNDTVMLKKDKTIAIVERQAVAVRERNLFQPLALVLFIHFLGLIPLYTLNQIRHSYFQVASIATSVGSLAMPFVLAFIVPRIRPFSQQALTLTSCFSLLLLGMFLSALATLNFSLAFLVGLANGPLSFVTGLRLTPELEPVSAPPKATTSKDTDVKRALRKDTSSETEPAASIRTPLETGILVLQGIILIGICPPLVIHGISLAWKKDIGNVLLQASTGWHVHGLWTQVVVWLVWWPAWTSASVTWLLSNRIIRM